VLDRGVLGEELLVQALVDHYQDAVPWERMERRARQEGAPLSANTFADMADVSPREVNLRFDRPHLSLGLGVRYDTPVGPIRFDAGYRVPGVQAPDSEDEVRQASETFGLPIALSFGIGEAF
jgi:outer membrane protein insertion porin family/translocation and assembly module TamA